METFSPVLALDYIIFDFGRRSQEISISRNTLLAANFQFNDTHRKVIFEVMQAYYRLLDTKGLQDAAEANLKNAQTVHQAAEARLQFGLATLPDVLEARSAAAQADYNLQAAIGATEIAHGDLATALGISPTVKFQVESIQTIKMPDKYWRHRGDFHRQSAGAASRPDATGGRPAGHVCGSERDAARFLSHAELRWQCRHGPRVRTARNDAGSLFAHHQSVGCAAHPVVDIV